MAKNVYICYDENDQEIANKVCSVLEKNKLSCWIKNRDASGTKHVIDDIISAIKSSKVMVLIFSKHSKISDFVKTDVDWAVSKDKPILIFNVDGSEIDGALEFYLKDQPSINAHPNPESQFDNLVVKTSQLVKQQRNWKKIIAVAVVVLLIAIVGIFAYTNMDKLTADTSQSSESVANATVKITDFHVDDVRKKGYDWNYSYYVGGTINPDLSSNGKYIISADFFDKSGNLVNTTEIPTSNAQRVSDGYLLASEVSDSKDISRVEVQIIDDKNTVIAQAESKI